MKKSQNTKTTVEVDEKKSLLQSYTELFDGNDPLLNIPRRQQNYIIAIMKKVPPFYLRKTHD